MRVNLTKDKNNDGLIVQIHYFGEPDVLQAIITSVRNENQELIKRPVFNNDKNFYLIKEEQPQEGEIVYTIGPSTIPTIKRTVNDLMDAIQLAEKIFLKFRQEKRNNY